MKKLVSMFVLASLTMTAAHAAPSYIMRDGQGGYNVTYNYTDKEKNGWYVALRAELSLLNWKNEYFSDDVGYGSSDKYSFEPIFGGSVSVGKKFKHFWRGEIEAGYTGLFTDKDQGIEFNLSAPYAMVNAMYDFTNGLYVGGGLGVAIPMTKLDGDIFLAGERSKTSVSPMAGLMVGYTHKLDDNFVVDVRYRLGGFMGTKHTRHFVTSAGATYYLENKIDLVLDNSFSIALRYEF